MNTQSDWFSHFITDEQQEHIIAFTNGQTFEEQKPTGQAWKTLFNDIRASMDKDMNSAAVQQLVARWDALIGQASPSDAEIAACLNNAYVHIDQSADPDNTPQSVVEWTQSMRDAAAFIHKARQARSNKNRRA